MKAGTERETRQGMFLFRSLNHVFYVWFFMIQKSGFFAEQRALHRIFQ